MLVTLMWAGDGGGHRGCSAEVPWGHCTCYGDTKHALGISDTPWEPWAFPGDPTHRPGALHDARDPPHSLGTLDTAGDLGHSLRTLHTPGTCQAAWALYIPGDPLASLGTLHAPPKLYTPSPLSRSTELLVPSLGCTAPAPQP